MLSESEIEAIVYIENTSLAQQKWGYGVKSIELYLIAIVTLIGAI